MTFFPQQVRKHLCQKKITCHTSDKSWQLIMQSGSRVAERASRKSAQHFTNCLHISPAWFPKDRSFLSVVCVCYAKSLSSETVLMHPVRNTVICSHFFTMEEWQRIKCPPVAWLCMENTMDTSRPFLPIQNCPTCALPRPPAGSTGCQAAGTLPVPGSSSLSVALITSPIPTSAHSADKSCEYGSSWWVHHDGSGGSQKSFELWLITGGFHFSCFCLPSVQAVSLPCQNSWA